MKLSIKKCIKFKNRIICIIKIKDIYTIFYKSSGTFSKNKNVWFPTTGIFIKEAFLENRYNKIWNFKNKTQGWIIKGYIENYFKIKKLKIWKYKRRKNSKKYQNKFYRLKSFKSINNFDVLKYNIINISLILKEKIKYHHSIINCNSYDCVKEFMLLFFNVKLH